MVTAAFSSCLSKTRCQSSQAAFCVGGGDARHSQIKDYSIGDSYMCGHIPQLGSDGEGGRKQNKSDPPLSLAAYKEFPSPFLSHPTAALSRTWFPSRSHSPLPLLLINLHASHVILNPASYPANLLTQLQMQRVPLKKNQCFFLGDNTLKTSQISSEELFCHFF